VKYVFSVYRGFERGTTVKLHFKAGSPATKIFGMVKRAYGEGDNESDELLMVCRIS